MHIYRSKNSSVNLVTKLHAGWLSNWHFILVRGKRFLSSQNCPGQLWDLCNLLFNGYWGDSLICWGKAASAWRWPLASNLVLRLRINTNEFSVSLCLLQVKRDNFIVNVCVYVQTSAIKSTYTSWRVIFGDSQSCSQCMSSHAVNM